MSPEADAHALMLGAAGVVRQYAGSDASRAAIDMLDRLTQCYWMELARVPEKDLRALQAALEQTQAVRAVLAGNAQALPLIGFF